MVATTFDPDALLDMQAGIGQFSCSFKFLLYDFPTGTVVQEVHPARDVTPVLSHDVTRTIVRQITNLLFVPEDTAVIDTIRHRVKVQMIIEGRDPYDLGIFMFLDKSRLLSTAGVQADTSMVDSMFIVDQQLEQTYAAGTFDPDGTIVSFRPVPDAVIDLLQGLPISVSIEPSPFYTIGVWAAGDGRGSAMEDLSYDGDYFSPWFDKTDTMRFIRVFDPATKIPQFDYDSGFKIDRDSIVFTDDLIGAPNRFIVISNGSVTDGTLPVVGSYDIPSSAPHSILNRGFVIPEVIDWQVDYTSQAEALAANFGQRQTLFERIEFTTSPDPRHDAYDVFHFQGVNWLELAWELPLTAGGQMRHLGRRTYT